MAKDDAHAKADLYPVSTDVPLQVFAREAERAYIVKALQNTDGNRRAAAEISGVPYETFCRKINKHGIKLRVSVEVI